MYRTCPDCGCALDPGEKCDCGGNALVKEPDRREPRVEIRTDSNGIKAIVHYQRTAK